MILFYTQLGYFGQFLIQQWQLRREARAAWLTRLPDSRFIAISLEEVKTSGKWEEAGREFSWHGQMYDVIRQKNIHGKTWLYCLNDEREAHLIEQSNNITSASQDMPEKKDLRLSFLKMGDTLLPGLESPAALAERTTRNPTFVFINAVLPDHFSAPPAPPPWNHPLLILSIQARV